MNIYEITKNDIITILQAEFKPLSLEVIDESSKHQGHAEALLHPKAGHYRVTMTSANFDGLSQIKRHRLVYEKLADLMDSKIHALSLKLSATNE